MTRGIPAALHLLRHESCPPSVERLSWLLSDEERAQAARFRFAADRAQRLLVHHELKSLVDEWAQCPNEIAVRAPI